VPGVVPSPWGRRERDVSRVAPLSLGKQREGCVERRPLSLGKQGEGCVGSRSLPLGKKGERAGETSLFVQGLPNFLCQAPEGKRLLKKIDAGCKRTVADNRVVCIA
jgi:hypothetical protein